MHSADDLQSHANEAGCPEKVLRIDYSATTNRMLRVAVNGFLESLRTVIEVMEELDLDVLHHKGLQDLKGVEGVEQGLTGSAGAAS